MKKLFLILFSVLFFSITTKATKLIIGTGSGSVSKTTMGTLVAGDTLAILAGSYSGGIQLGSALHDLTIINSGGVVTSTATLDLGASGGTTMQNIHFSGTGVNGTTYGFIFDATGVYGSGQVGFTSNSGIYFTAQHYIGIRVDHVWFKSILANCFDLQGIIPTYDGTTASFALYKGTFSYCRADNSLEFYQGNYKSGNLGLSDSVDISYNIINQTSGNGLTVNTELTNYNIHHNQVLYSGYNAQTNDVGIFSMLGFGQIHHNYVKGGRGWLARLVSCGFKGNPVATCYGYNNVKIATNTYGVFDCRADSVNFFAPISSFFQHGNFVIVNNSFGNETANDANGTGTGNGYNTPVALFYHMDNGSTGVVKNNIGFNSVIGSPGGYICVSFASDQNGNGLGFSQIDTSNNRYYTASTILSVLSDTSANCAVLAGAPLLGAGVNFSFVTTDFLDRTRPNPPSIGAEEFSAAPACPCLLFTKPKKFVKSIN